MSVGVAVNGAGFEIAYFKDIAPQTCPCGPSRRAFVDGDGSMSIHRVEIRDQDREHRHVTDEIYYVLACGPDASMILNGKRYAVRPGAAVKIKGGTWHCADKGGDEPMVVLVVVATGHGSPQATMEFPSQNL